MNNTIKVALLAGTIIAGLSTSNTAQAAQCAAGANAANCEISNNTTATQDMTLNGGVTATIDTTGINNVGGRITGTTNGDGSIILNSGLTFTQNGQIGRTSGGAFNGVGSLTLQNNAIWDSNQVLNVGAVNMGTGSVLRLGTTTHSLGGNFLGSISGSGSTSVVEIDQGADLTFDAALNNITLDITDLAFANTGVNFNATSGSTNPLFDILIGTNNYAAVNIGVGVNAQGSATTNDTTQGELYNEGIFVNNGTFSTHDVYNAAGAVTSINTTAITTVTGDFVNEGILNSNSNSAGALQVTGGLLNTNSGTITISNGGDFTINGTLPANTISVNGSAFAKSGFATAGLENQGTININSTLSSLNLTGGGIINYSTGSITSMGDVDATFLTNDGAFTVENNSDTDFTGNLQNANNGASITANGNAIIDANNFTQVGTSTLDLNDTSNLDIAFTSNITSGTVNMDAGTSFTNGANLTMAGGVNFNVELANDDVPSLTGVNIDIDNATISVIDGGGNNLSDGDSFLLADATNAQTITQRTLGMIDGFNIDLVSGTFGTIGGDATQAYLVAILAAISGAQGANNTEVQEILNTIIGSSDPNMSQIITNLQNASTTSEYNQILESLLPTTDGGDFTGALQVVGQTLDVTSDRLDMLTNGKLSPAQLNNIKSAAGGKETNSIFGPGVRFWSQLFGRAADQDSRNNIGGYDAKTLGVAVGADTENLLEHTILGLALSYANTNVDSDNANDTSTDVNSYQLTAYGNHELDSRSYLRGIAAYVYGDNTRTRHNVGAISGLNAKGKFKSHMLALHGELGREYTAPEYTDAVLIPSASLRYTHYSAQDFTETGAGGANLSVDQDNVNKLDLGVGIDAQWQFTDHSGGIIVPEVRGGVSYDLIGDKLDTDSQFTAGGGSFETEGLEPGRFAVNIGTGVTYQTPENWDLSVNYDLEKKAGFHSHSGQVRATYSF